MATYWTNFAKHGAPNGKGVPKWPQFTAKSPNLNGVAQRKVVNGQITETFKASPNHEAVPLLILIFSILL